MKKSMSMLEEVIQSLSKYTHTFNKDEWDSFRKTVSPLYTDLPTYNKENVVSYIEYLERNIFSKNNCFTMSAYDFSMLFIKFFPNYSERIKEDNYDEVFHVTLNIHKRARDTFFPQNTETVRLKEEIQNSYC